MNIKLFKDFINEQIREKNPIKDKFSIQIKHLHLKGVVEDLIKFTDNYKIEKINLIDIKLPIFIQDPDNQEVITIKPHTKLPDNIKKDINKSSLKYPVLLVVENGKIITILDGNHRILKSRNMGNKIIDAKLIPFEDLKNF